MKNAFLLTALSALISLPAFAGVGSCEKPSQIAIPQDVTQLSLPQFENIHNQGEAYMDSARNYLKCLDRIIYSTVPEDPIVSKAGHAHQEYGQEWGSVWGSLNLACVNWEVAHGAQFPGGCQPTNPTEAPKITG